MRRYLINPLESREASHDKPDSLSPDNSRTPDNVPVIEGFTKMNGGARSVACRASGLTVAAAEGYSSYGNQIGLATGYVKERYHEGYIAKRLETGALLAEAVKKAEVVAFPDLGVRRSIS